MHLGQVSALLAGFPQFLHGMLATTADIVCGSVDSRR